MSIVRRHRLFARMAAYRGGYFWLPCPVCGRHFGGQEWVSVDGHAISVPIEVERNPETGGIRSTTGKGICPACTAAGVGCRAWSTVGIRTHPGCVFLSPIEVAPCTE